jgi:hypothetical protein
VASLEFKDADGVGFSVVSGTALTERDGIGSINVTIEGDPKRLAQVGMFSKVIVQETGTSAVNYGETLNTYRLLTQRTDNVAATRPRFSTWTGVTNIGWYLERAKLGTGWIEGEADNKVHFVGKNPGQIVNSIINKCQARPSGGALNYNEFNWNFGPVVDSIGDPWPAEDVPDREYAMNDSVLDVLDDLRHMGLVNWWIENDTLHMVRYDSGRDLTEGADQLIIDAPQQATESPQNRSGTDAANVCWVAGAPGHMRVIDLTIFYERPIPNLPRIECAIDVPDVADHPTLDIIGTLEIYRRMNGPPTSGAGVAISQTVNLKLTELRAPMPGLRFNLGDMVVFRGGNGDDMRLRTDAYLLTADQNGVVAARVNFGDRLEAQNARYGRMIARLIRSNRVTRA